MREVTDAAFQHDVLESERPVVVDFWAPWCGPCRAIEPILAELEREHGAVVEFVKVDIDQNVETAARLGVLSIPTVMVFAGGRLEETVIGARSRAHYERALERWLEAAA